MAPTSLSLSQPWDIDDVDTSIAGVANQSVAAGNSTDLEDMGIGQIETNEQTHQFDIKYTETFT
jgi:hypothetical protein